MTSPLLHPRSQAVETIGTRAGPLPNFLIIGAQRSGTTSLARYLAAHPDIYVARQKEVHYFDRYLDKGEDWYKTQFRIYDEVTAVGEATPEYMYLPDVPARMASLLPDAKLIAILRNPVDRAYSDFHFVRGRGYETLSFEGAIDAEEERLAARDDSHRIRFAYLDRGHYVTQLRRVCAKYERDRLLVLLFEDFRRDPASSYRQVCSFLGVDDRYLPATLGRRFGRSQTFRSRALRRVAKRLPYPFGAIVSRMNARSNSYPPMDTRTRANLLQHFADDNAALADWLQRDLSIWNR